MMEDNFSTLVKVAAAREMALMFGTDGDGRIAIPPGFESRMMLAVARGEIERARRRAKIGLVASLSGVSTIAAAACVAVVVWLPPRVVLSFDLGVALETVISSIRALF